MSTYCRISCALPFLVLIHAVPALAADILSQSAEFFPLGANPLVGDWDLTPLGGSSLQLEPFSQVILVAGVGAGGDSDGDGDVDGADFLAGQVGLGMTQHASPSDGYFDDNGQVDGLDLVIWQSGVGTVSSPLGVIVIPRSLAVGGSSLRPPARGYLRPVKSP